MKKLLLILLCLPILVLSQTRNCGTMEYLEYLKAQDPQLEQRMAQDEIDLQNRIQNQSNSKSSSIIVIPVVVHVVYSNSTENISTAQIQSQIDILNEDFRRLNADASSTPLTFQSVAADVEVDFCLASRDPNGQPTTGITRTSTSQSPFSANNNYMKYNSSGGIDAWNTSDYLNIWVCDLSSLLGYAQFPNTGISNTDGVVCDYAYFGNIGTATAPYDLGRTATHEVGHWLNLRHIWGDATCGDDFCNDTPTQETQNYNCQSFPHVTCNNGPNGDMFMNYMDYSDDACMNMFTEDQKTRMIDAINTHRTGLLTSNGCSTGGCTSVLAYNYDPSAGIDDGSCCFLAGCTDPAGDNYNANACEDNASCVYSGCTDPAATNYSAIASIDDGSCIYCVYGCMNSLALNYNPAATCPTTGCNFSLATWDDVGCDSIELWYDDMMMWGYPFWVDGTGTYAVGEIYAPDPLDPWNYIWVGTDYSSVLVNYSTSNTTTQIACDSYTWAVDGNTYTTSGTYTDVSANAAGCNHIEALELTINNSTTFISYAAACDSYTWAVDGNTYASSGIYTSINTNPSGCDDTEILVLTIENSTSNTTTVSVCDTYTWAIDGNTYTTSGTYTDVSTNTAGCDHTETLNLTINYSTTSADNVGAHCDSYTWIDGVTYTASNNTATFISTNANGCDHTETLELTINSVIPSISQSGDSLFAVTTPIGLTANWYNIQTEDATTRIWLMEEGATTFMPRFDCSYFIVVSHNACIDTSEIYSYGANAARIGSFITSPNPTSGLVNVKFDNPKNQFVMFELISNNGSKLDEFITVENNLNIDLSNYPSGSYYLYFNSEDATQGCRLEEVQKVSTKIILNK